MNTTKAKNATLLLKNQDTVDDRDGRVHIGRGSSNHPTEEELREWAATQRRLHKAGELPEEFVKALEEVPGWTWDLGE